MHHTDQHVALTQLCLTVISSKQCDEGMNQNGQFWQQSHSALLCTSQELPFEGKIAVTEIDQT